MPLTAEQKKKFADAFNRKNSILQRCPICQANYVSTTDPWEIGELVEVFTQNPSTGQTNVETVSMIQHVCKQCGYVQLFNTNYLLA